MAGEAPAVTRETHEALARAANGEVWDLLEKAGRSAEESERMVHAAHACSYHWLHAGTAVHQQRGEWLLSRVYTVLGREQAALHHARRCLELTERHLGEMKDFDLAYAQEAMARVGALVGDREETARRRAAAEALGSRIADPEDRQIFLGDLAAGPW